eukprot:SAG22_NODE_444_length_10453_cov_8.586343_5_plen_249_part_00
MPAYSLLVWQVSDEWATGGWGGIEAGSGPGSVVGGRWKPLQHFYAQYLYSPVSVAVTAQGRAYVRNGLPHGITGKLNVTALHLGTMADDIMSAPISIEVGASWIAWADVTAVLQACPKESCVLVSTVVTTTTTGVATTAAQNVQLLAAPWHLQMPDATVSFAFATDVVDSGAADGTNSSVVALSVTTNFVALAVALTTSADGYFSPNYFLAMPGTTAVNFVLFDGVDRGEAIAALHATTRVEHLAQRV